MESKPDNFYSGPETIWKFTSCDSSNDLCQKQCINRNHGISRGKIDALLAPATVSKWFNGLYISPELSPVFKGLYKGPQQGLLMNFNFVIYKLEPKKVILVCLHIFNFFFSS